MSTRVRYHQRLRLDFVVVEQQKIEINTAFTPVPASLAAQFKLGIEQPLQQRLWCHAGIRDYSSIVKIGLVLRSDRC